MQLFSRATLLVMVMLCISALSSPAAPSLGCIQGQVVDARSRMPLPGASVWAGDIGATTDAQGRFVLRGLGAGPHTLESTYIGYQPFRLEGVRLGAQGVVEVVVELVERPIALSEITVTPGRFAVMGKEPASSQALTREEIQSIPQFGEDIYRAVVRLPGVAGDDFSAKFTVRGGEHDQVLVLLDGLELNDPFHLKDINGGALSIVDVSLIEGVELLTGGFPAEYGDRRSGVFNIKTIRPPPGQQQVGAGVGLMNTRAFARGSSARGNWMVSVRRGYLDMVLDLMGEDNAPRPTYYDALAKVEYRLDDHHTLAAHFLGAQDRMDFVEDDADVSNTKYENTYTWLTLNSVCGPHLLAQTLLAYGQGDHQRQGLALKGNRDQVDFRVSDKRDSGFWGLKQDWSWEAGERLFLKWGADLRQLSTHYDYLSQKERDQALGDSLRHWTDTTQVMLAPSGNRAAGYLAARVSLAAPLKAEAGLRYDRASYVGEGEFSPRLNLVWALGKQTSLRAGWGRFYQSQGIGELRVEEGERAFYPAELATHWVAGLERRFAGGPQLRVEGYYKKGAHLRPVYRNWHDAIEIFPELQDDRVTLDLSGATAKGLEVYLKQDVGGKFTWWASYGLAWSREQVEMVRWAEGQLPLDQELPGRYDQRHTFYLDANYRPTPRWHLNLAWQYRSGWPYTERSLHVGTLPDGRVYVYEEAGQPYARNYPAFHRLDLRLSRHFDLSKGRISAFLEMVNLYNHGNVRAYEYGLIRLPSGELRQTQSPEYWFRLLPSVGLSWTWDY
ncbi:MAG: TonB-dependent receptor [Candidatus Latescibacteria bacterium]|nr:TonB-dependent receptor [Candidatus Latescibacterota bacterium]